MIEAKMHKLKYLSGLIRSRKAGSGGFGGGSISVSLIEFPDPKILSEEAEWCN